MSQVECVFFDSDGTLVDSEVLCCKAYVHLFAHHGIRLSLPEVTREFKGVKLYDIIGQLGQRHGLSLIYEDMEVRYRQEVARLFEEELAPIPYIEEVLSRLRVPMCVTSNGPVSKMQHALKLTGLAPYFGDNLYSSYDIQRWKPDPALMYYAAEQMGVPLSRCILVEDSAAGVQAGMAAGIPVFYYCADPHNTPIHHSLVTMFDDMRMLPALWQARGWQILHAEQDRETEGAGSPAGENHKQ